MSISPSAPFERSSRYAWGVAFCLLLAAVLRFGGLAQESYWFDEVHSLRMGDAGGFGAVREALREDVHPPLYFWALGWWTRVFSDSERGARSLSAVLGVALVGLVYLWSRALGLPRRAGLIAACLLAVNPHAVLYSQEVRMYAMATFLGTAFLAAWSRVLFPPGAATRHDTAFPTGEGGAARRRSAKQDWLAISGWAAASAALGVAVFWTHFYGVFFLATAGAMAGAASGRLRAAKQPRRRLAETHPVARAPWWTPMAAAAALGAGWLALSWPLIADMLDRMRSGQGISWLAGLYAVTWRTPGEVARALIAEPLLPVVPRFLAAAAIAGAMLLIAASAQPPTRRRRIVPALATLLLIGLPVAVSLRTVVILGGQRYLTVAVPAVCLAMGLGAHRMLARRRAWAMALTGAALAAVVVAQSLYLVRYYGDREKRMWREAAEFVRLNARPGDRVATTPDYSRWVIEHYGVEPAHPVTLAALFEPPPGDPTENTKTPIPTPRSTDGRVWMLSVAEQASYEDLRLESEGWRLASNQSVVGLWSSSLVRITLYNPPD